MDRQEAQRKINEHVQEAHAALKRAESVADMFGIEFSFDVGCYGAGATYYPERFTREKALELIESGRDLTPEERTKVADVLRNPDEYEEDEWRSSYTGWQSSSSMC
jgi:hypothetical protein